MNPGLLRKAWAEVWPATLLLAILLIGAEALLAYVIPTYQRGVIGSVLSQSTLAQNFIKAILGSATPVGAGPELFMAFAWAHPAPLALVWAHSAIACTRSPAGEVDRGTIDLLLGLPVSRWGVYIADSAVWFGTAVLLLGVMLAANRVGALLGPPETLAPARNAMIVAVNLLALAFAVGGVASLVSAMSDRRGRALTIVFVILLTMFLLNFLAQIWTPAARVSWLSILKYYRPIYGLRDGVWPWGDLATLGAIGGVCWAAGGVIFARRDLAAA